MLLGRDQILYIRISVADPWTPIGCLTTDGFNESAEMLDTTTRDNKGWSTSVPGRQSYNITFSGVQIKTTTTPFSYDFLTLFKRNKVRLYWKREIASQGLEQVGQGYIVSLSETADVGDYLSFDGEMVGYGLPVSSVDTQPPTAPTLGLGVQTEDYITLIWSESTDDVGVAGYNIYRNNTIYVTVGPVETFYLDYGIIDGQKYSYNVSAFDIAGNESALSNKVLSNTASKPGANYLLFENDINAVLLLEDGSPLLLET